MPLRTPHALNVAGDFYVEDACCTSCELPFFEAPGHFKYDDGGHCYVCKQPSTPEQVAGMIGAVKVSEVKCIRYAGNDTHILERMVELGEKDQCDALPCAPNVAEKVTLPKIWWAFWRR